MGAGRKSGAETGSGRAGLEGCFLYDVYLTFHFQCPGLIVDLGLLLVDF